MLCRRPELKSGTPEVLTGWRLSDSQAASACASARAAQPGWAGPILGIMLMLMCGAWAAGRREARARAHTCIISRAGRWAAGAHRMAASARSAS